jgi:hypothetical protein
LRVAGHIHHERNARCCDALGHGSSPCARRVEHQRARASAPFERVRVAVDDARRKTARAQVCAGGLACVGSGLDTHEVRAAREKNAQVPRPREQLDDRSAYADARADLLGHVVRERRVHPLARLRKASGRQTERLAVRASRPGGRVADDRRSIRSLERNSRAGKRAVLNGSLESGEGRGGKLAVPPEVEDRQPAGAEAELDLPTPG